MRASDPQTRPQPRSITLTFAQPDPASFIQGSAAALLLLALPPLLGLANMRGLLGATVVSCGIYAIITACIAGDTISTEHTRENRRLENGGVEGEDEKPRDGSYLSVRSEMPFAAYCRVVRRGCFGLVLVYSGFMGV